MEYANNLQTPFLFPSAKANNLQTQIFGGYSEMQYLCGRISKT